MGKAHRRADASSCPQWTDGRGNPDGDNHVMQCRLEQLSSEARCLLPLLLSLFDILN